MAMTKEETAAQVDELIQQGADTAAAAKTALDNLPADASWQDISSARAIYGAAVQSQQYWQDYKNRNPALWQPDPEPEQSSAAAPETDYVAPITMRQFYQQAAIAGYISNDEALAAITGTIPDNIAAMLADLPADEAFDDKMLLKSGDIIAYDNPLVDQIGQIWGIDKDGEKEFFENAGKL